MLRQKKSTVMLDHRSGWSITLLPAIMDEWMDDIFPLENRKQNAGYELTELIKSIRSSLSSLYHNLGSQLLPPALMNMTI